MKLPHVHGGKTHDPSLVGKRKNGKKIHVIKLRDSLPHTYLKIPFPEKKDDRQ